MTKTQQARKQRLMPGGIPRYVRCYDNGDTPEATVDRYTAVFIGRYSGHPHGNHEILAMSGAPFHPQGFCQHTEGTDTLNGKWPPAIGRKNHLGVRIPFMMLPEPCRRVVLEDYRELWGLVDNLEGKA